MFANYLTPPLEKLPNKKICACGVNATACTIFASENRSYLGEFEAEFQKALFCDSGPREDYLMKKTEGRKSRDTVPLNFQASCVVTENS
jgi:hypothetical protein